MQVFCEEDEIALSMLKELAEVTRRSCKDASTKESHPDQTVRPTIINTIHPFAGIISALGARIIFH
ncbi:hypothetical protein Cpin_5123 [Chitinophaga pinensis DSM 2588]|uniref:Uncharacterized protein n=1 Tax=Chitinophaga pinensis (strain ATCC 43595 / DSM 2588 / LMG 13176 / NBRC 15968 / NCIMB 11800 / UQM 2034) TaxID=485918 RepID=A0A979GZG6_CHIPD|nr:hypothetical protein Cpin_5123 [Chitinophaga pinensis DSM 2588]